MVYALPRFMLGRAARQSLGLGARGAERSDISQEVPTHQEKKTQERSLENT